MYTGTALPIDIPRDGSASVCVDMGCYIFVVGSDVFAKTYIDIFRYTLLCFFCYKNTIGLWGWLEVYESSNNGNDTK